jgi:uncharacterized protein
MTDMGGMVVSEQDADDKNLKSAARALLGVPLSAEQLQRIRERLEEIRGYIPKVGVLGKTGVGKSSLCNVLFGKEVAKVDGVEACTREIQQVEILAADGNGGIVLIDVPGVGESSERDEAYTRMYEELLPQLDLVLWVIKADDRALSIDIEVFEAKVRKGAPSVLFVINQVDKLDPVREWDLQAHSPGERQLLNIERKCAKVSDAFQVSAATVCAVSAEEKYGLTELVDLIVKTVPNEKKAGFFREARKETRSTQSAKEVEKGIWESIKEFVGDAAKKAGDFYRDNKEAVHLVVGALWTFFTNEAKRKK